MSRRLVGLSIAAVVEVLLGFFYAYYGVSEIVGAVRDPNPAVIIHANVQVVLSVTFIAGGIGLVLMKSWGRQLNLIISVIFGLYELFSLGGILLTLPAREARNYAPFLAMKGGFVVLSALLFFYLMRPAVKGAFGSPRE